MIEIKVQELTKEAFAPFGEYYDMVNPDGHALCGEIHQFYPDRITEAYFTRAAFSPLVVKRPEEMVIKQLEYHNNSPEIILPLTGDVIIHVGPASAGTPVTEKTKAFYVKKGTLVKLKTAIWHLAPLPVDEQVTVLIVLPELTYAKDCPVVDLKEEEQFRIVR
ncbi:MAG: DUF4867 family protein [Eubacterium sp.]|nr:DUF4867 family protein [Eubacterium sp.]